MGSLLGEAMSSFDLTVRGFFENVFLHCDVVTSFPHHVLTFAQVSRTAARTRSRLLEILASALGCSFLMAPYVLVLLSFQGASLPPVA